MDTDRMRKAAQWYYNTVYRDEPLTPRPQQEAEKLPSALQAARSLENSAMRWQSRESIFLKQAKLLVNYEDDYPFSGTVVRYFPTYQSLTDRELRGYFSWRTKLCRGQVEKTSLSFAFLYIYELLNQVGVDTPMAGYEQLRRFLETYGGLDDRVVPYLKRWLFDYCVYYQLPPELLSDTERAGFDRSVWVFTTLPERSQEEVMEAVKALAPKWLDRSKFYAENRSDCDRVIVGVLRRLSEHYAARCKRGLAEQLFGSCMLYPVDLFSGAVFLDSAPSRNLDYAVGPVRSYHCRGKLWTVRKFSRNPKSGKKLEALVKAVDASMRVFLDYGRPIQCKVETKWILKTIEEEITGLLEEKKRAQQKVLRLDYAHLSKIRQDANLTRDKLMVDEEWEEECSPAPAALPQPVAQPSSDCPLDPMQYRLLQSLLYGGGLSWVREQGLLLSVLVDGVNEALYDTFLDNVLLAEDPPQVLEDYEVELKEMVHP